MGDLGLSSRRVVGEQEREEGFSHSNRRVGQLGQKEKKEASEEELSIEEDGKGLQGIYVRESNGDERRSMGEQAKESIKRAFCDANSIGPLGEQSL